MATGRKPNTADLHLEMQESNSDQMALLVNPEMRTSAHHIWASGDVTGEPMPVLCPIKFSILIGLTPASSHLVLKYLRKE